MNAFRSGDVKGTWGTLLLPINPDDTIDYSRLREEIVTLATSGVDGIYSNGTAGEFHAQTEDEFDVVSMILAAECEKRKVPFQIGVSHMSAQTSLGRLRRAISLKPAAVQVILPDWSPSSLPDALAFLERMGEVAAPVGLIVYNPPHAKRILTPDEWRVIAERVPAVIGMKVAGGDAAWYDAMRPVLSRLSVFVAGHTLATGLARGASGAYSNVACLSPRGAVWWFNLMRTNPQQALEIEGKIQGFLKAHIRPLVAEHGYTNSALDKLLAAIGGWANVGTRLRWPYQWVPESEVARLRVIAEREFPELIHAQSV